MNPVGTLFIQSSDQWNHQRLKLFAAHGTIKARNPAPYHLPEKVTAASSALAPDPSPAVSRPQPLPDCREHHRVQQSGPWRVAYRICS